MLPRTLTIQSFPSRLCVDIRKVYVWKTHEMGPTLAFRQTQYLLAASLRGPSHGPYLVFLVIDMLPLIVNLDGQLFNLPLQFPVGGLQHGLLPKTAAAG